MKSKFKEGDVVRYRLNDTTLECTIHSVSNKYFSGGNGRLYSLLTKKSYSSIDRKFINGRNCSTVKGKLLFWGCDVSLRAGNGNQSAGW